MNHVKVVLELKSKPKAGDILVFDGEYFEPISKNKFLKELKEDIVDINLALENIDSSLNNINREISLLKGEEE